MAKKHEIDYLDRLTATLDAAESEATIELHRDKPYAFGHQCGGYLVDIGSIMRLLPHPPARLLDLGVGTGWTSVIYARNGYEVVGQDIAPKMIELAEKNRDRDRAKMLKFVVSDYENLGMHSEFDCAVFYDSLHHAEDEEAALRAAFESLKPGGILVTLEPGEGHATSGDTRRAVQRFGTTEKDMPPHHILTLGSKIGYLGGAVYAHPEVPIPAYEESGLTDGSVALDRRGKWRRAGSLVKGAWRVLMDGSPATPPRPGVPADVRPIVLRTRSIVVMRKPMA